MYVSGIEIERSQKAFRIVIKTSRPGMIIGRSGEGATRRRNDGSKKLAAIGGAHGGELSNDIEEVRSPDANATIGVQMMADGLAKLSLAWKGELHLVQAHSRLDTTIDELDLKRPQEVLKGRVQEHDCRPQQVRPLGPRTATAFLTIKRVYQARGALEVLLKSREDLLHGVGRHRALW